MISIKLEDINKLFNDKAALKEAHQNFPNDPLGDLLIKVHKKEFHLQKNVLGKSSAYFGQLATIRYLQMIEIQENEIDPPIFTKCLKVLYGFSEEFELADLEKIFDTSNFLRSKDIKSCLIGQIKQIVKNLNIDQQIEIFQFAFLKQIMALSSYFIEIFQKMKLIEQFDDYKSSFLKLDEKSLIVLLVNQYQHDNPDEKNDIEINNVYPKVIEYFCQKKHINLNNFRSKLENQLLQKKEKMIQKEDQKKDVTQLAKELRDLRGSQEIILKKVDDMKRSERKHQHIITNLTQKVKSLEKAVLYLVGNNEQVKDIFKSKKKKKSQEKKIPETMKQSSIFNLFNRNKTDIVLNKQYTFNEIMPIFIQKFHPSIEQLVNIQKYSTITLIFDAIRMNFQLSSLLQQTYKGDFLLIIKNLTQTFGLTFKELKQGKYCDPSLTFFSLDPLNRFYLKPQYKNINNINLSKNQFRFADDIQLFINGKPDCNLFTIGSQFEQDYEVNDISINNLFIFQLN